MERPRACALVLGDLGSNPSSATRNSWALEQVCPPCCASHFLSEEWVAVKIKYINFCKGLEDLDVSVLCKEGFAVNIIISLMLMVTLVPSFSLCRIYWVLFSLVSPLPCSKSLKELCNSFFPKSHFSSLKE